MLLPSRLYVITLASLLWGTSAVGQPVPVRLSQPRSVVLLGQPEAAPEIRVAPGATTLLRLDAAIVRESVQVDEQARFTLDAGDQTIAIEPMEALKPEARHSLHITFRAGSPASAAFLLVPGVGEVDTVISVRRPPQSLSACQAEWVAMHERCEAPLREKEAPAPPPSPAALVLAGLLDETGAEGVRLDKCPQLEGELRTRVCVGLRGPGWIVVAATVSNAGAQPWRPVQATLRPTVGGEPREGRIHLFPREALGPGQEVHMAVEVELPRRKRNRWLTERHTLTVCDTEGRCLIFKEVRL